MRSEVDSFSWNWTQFQDQPGQLWLTSLDAGVSDLTHSAAEKGAVTWVASDGTFAPAADPGSQSYLQRIFSSCWNIYVDDYTEEHHFCGVLEARVWQLFLGAECKTDLRFCFFPQTNWHAARPESNCNQLFLIQLVREIVIIW